MRKTTMKANVTLRARALSVLTCAALLGAGCAGPASQEQAGMVIGGVLGGALGSQIGHGHGGGRTAATVIGALAGMAIGGSIGRSMDDNDRLKTAHAMETVRSGVPSTWRNPDSGHEYRVTPMRTYQTAQGPCREYQMEGLIGGRRENLVGNACRQADGSWRVMP
jgi:surface antigen